MMKFILLLSLLALTYAQSTNGCGLAFPRGCPTGASCVSAASGNGERVCVCNTQGGVIDPLSNTCISPCPDFATRENGTCRCVPPYVPSVSNAGLVCILGGGATCSNINCPLGFHCEFNNSASVPVCVRDPTAAVCGTDFRCPDSVRYVCVDSPNGPFCQCAPQYAGPLCVYRRCDGSNGTLVCPDSPVGTTCVAVTANAGGSVGSTDATTNAAVCVCPNGRSPPDCATPDPCANKTCPQANSVCVAGRCVCQDGNVAVLDSNTRSFSCQPAANCSTITCTGNTRCVIENNTPKCVCPVDRYGAYDCSRPGCNIDTDCPSVNSYCVNNTLSVVGGFCVCKPGYTGDNCSRTIPQCSCDATSQVCTNEGRCVCAAGYNGDNCTQVVPPVCVTIIIVVRKTADQTPASLQNYIAGFVNVDRAVITVSGPNDVNATYETFTVRICRDNNTDETATGNDLVQNSNNGKASSAGIDGASYSGGMATTGGMAATMQMTMQMTGSGQSAENGAAMNTFAWALVCLVLAFA